MLEIVVVVAIVAVVAAMAIPNLVQLQRNARLNGDAHSMSETLSVAKMRAAADFTESRVFFATATDSPQFFRIDVWNKAANGGVGCWVPDDVNNPGTGTTFCVSRKDPLGYETYVSPGVSAGFSSVPTAWDGSTAAQAAPCYAFGTVPRNGNGSVITGTSCIQFNSRGFPNPGGAFYITDGTRVYEISANTMGLIKSYVSPASSAGWVPY